ncbi:MAG TPA: hypothetical protein VNU95_02200 [Candidatus Acidoferrales bacterium]|jgi:hypothetical protein|nr:hypothetical protein [Candidatus Acidoferrales bacterium]
MKTPREVLFERHWAARPKLDAIRREMVAKINHQGAKAQSERINLASWCLGSLNKIWRELIFPSRRIWAGLAAVWILIFAANFSMRDQAVTPMAKASTPAQMAASFQEQQELLAQLIGPNEPVVAEPQKKYVPRPSSWRPFELMTT